MIMDRNEAIKVVKSHYPANKQMLNEALECLIPELKESKDERIRKAIIEYLRQRLDRSPSIPAAIGSWIAWLEKQGEQKLDWNKEDEKMIGRLRDIVEKYAFSHSAVDVNGELCEKEYIEADNWLKSLKQRIGG